MIDMKRLLHDLNGMYYGKGRLLSILNEQSCLDTFIFYFSKVCLIPFFMLVEP